MFCSFYPFESLDVGAISATNPPYRNITITYNIDSVAINDSGIYECEKGAVKKTFTLTVVGEKTSKNYSYSTI